MFTNLKVSSSVLKEMELNTFALMLLFSFRAKWGRYLEYQ